MSEIVRNSDYVLEEALETTAESGKLIKVQRGTRVEYIGTEEQTFGIVNRYKILGGPHNGEVIVTQQGSYVDRCFGGIV